MTERQEKAQAKFIEMLIDGGFAKDHAEKVFQFYQQENLVKFDYVNTRYVVKHGALLDKQTIINAIQMIED